MNIPDDYFILLVNELKTVEKLCNEAKTPEDRLYFFSGTYGIINRIMNFHCDPTLVFMHQILQSAHQGISNRLAISTQEGVVSKSLPTSLFEKLFSLLSTLIQAIEVKNTEKIREILEKYSNITYATSGNGFYLFYRDRIKI